tara:strand:- start:18 stop:251 length:234 start_codon:yes stop_codon:yes gene_type:complete
MGDKKPKKGSMSMLERWKFDEDNFMDDLFGTKSQNGPVTLYYPNGEKKGEGVCVKGKLVGKWTYYNEDGSIKKVEEY